jgi:uncharacterized membrane protein
MAKRKRPNRPNTQVAPLDGRANVASTEQRVAQLVAHQEFSGPLPHPDIFRKYGEIIPNAPERILKVFEEDSAHIRSIQFAALNAECRESKRAHWMAWSLIFFGFLLVAFLAWLDKEWLAGIALGTTLAGTIAGFLQDKHRPQQQ